MRKVFIALLTLGSTHAGWLDIACQSACKIGSAVSATWQTTASKKLSDVKACMHQGVKSWDLENKLTETIAKKFTGSVLGTFAHHAVSLGQEIVGVHLVDIQDSAAKSVQTFDVGSLNPTMVQFGVGAAVVLQPYTFLPKIAQCAGSMTSGDLKKFGEKSFPELIQDNPTIEKIAVWGAYNLAQTSVISAQNMWIQYKNPNLGKGQAMPVDWANKSQVIEDDFVCIPALSPSVVDA